MIFDEFKKKFILDNQNMVSRGGLTLVPFLDLKAQYQTTYAEVLAALVTDNAEFAARARRLRDHGQSQR